MRTVDHIRLATEAVFSQRLRSLLTGTGIAVGVAAVVLLTALGEGVNRFVMGEFTQFGTHIIAVNPGTDATSGVSGAMINTVRPLSLQDTESLRTLPGVRAVTPVIQGNAEVETTRRSRWTTVLGVGAEAADLWQMAVQQGRFLPADDPFRPRPFAVLGARVADEVFPRTSPVGQRIRIGGQRLRVVGVMAPKGQILGFDMDDTVYIPAAHAQALFDREGVMEIDILYRPSVTSAAMAEQVRGRLAERHGREDFTITTQEDMLATLGDILGMLTLVVAGLGGISLVVGGVGILTIMTIAVNERTPEIGLLRALGATRRTVLLVFLGEAALLGALGGLAGLGIGLAGAGLLHWLVPALPVSFHPPFILAAEGVALVTGVVGGLIPAWRAARMDPVEALRTE